MLDCYGQLTFRDALEIGHVLDELHFTWFEEPIPDSRIYQLKKLAQELRTPVIAGETITLGELPQYVGSNRTNVPKVA